MGCQAFSHSCFTSAQCVKRHIFVQKFNIASEASYVYIMSGQKFIKNSKNDWFWKLEVKQCYQTGQFLKGQKLVKNAQFQTFKYDILGNFLNNVDLQGFVKTWFFGQKLLFWYSVKRNINTDITSISISKRGPFPFCPLNSW